MTELLDSPPNRRTSFWERARIEVTPYCSSLSLLLLFVLFAWMAFNWFETIHRLVRYYNPLPAWDYWRAAKFVSSYRSFDIRVLWQQHNEHRIVFPEIVFAADFLLLHGRQLLPLAVSFLCYFASWIVLAWAFWSERAISPLVRKTGILLAGIVIGWEGSAAVLASAFLLQWTLMQIAVLLSLAFLSRLREAGKKRYLVAVVVSAVVATYSSGNGMMLWPILLGAGVLLSLTRRHLITLSIAAVLSISIYFIKYNFTGHLTISNFFRQPLYSLEFVGSYLSMPFGGMKSPEFGACLGLVSLGIVVVLAVLSARMRLLRFQAWRCALRLVWIHSYDCASDRRRKNGSRRPPLQWRESGKIPDGSACYMGCVYPLMFVAFCPIQVENSISYRNHFRHCLAAIARSPQIAVVVASTRRSVRK